MDNAGRLFGIVLLTAIIGVPLVIYGSLYGFEFFEFLQDRQTASAPATSAPPGPPPPPSSPVPPAAPVPTPTEPVVAPIAPQASEQPQPSAQPTPVPVETPAEPAPTNPPPVEPVAANSPLAEPAPTNHSGGAAVTPIPAIPAPIPTGNPELDRIRQQQYEFIQQQLERQRAAMGGVQGANSGASGVQADSAANAPPIRRLSDVSAGDQVFIFWRTRWLPGHVVRIQKNMVRVHYEGWNDSYDETVTIDRLRVRQAAAKTAESDSPPKPAPVVNPFEPATPAIRTWTDSSGQFKIEAELIGVTDGMAQFKKTDGKTISVPVDKLSAEDQKVIRSQQP